jgi:hypothetical protein
VVTKNHGFFWSRIQGVAMDRMLAMEAIIYLFSNGSAESLRHRRMLAL